MGRPSISSKIKEEIGRVDEPDAKFEMLVRIRKPGNIPNFRTLLFYQNLERLRIGRYKKFQGGYYLIERVIYNFYKCSKLGAVALKKLADNYDATFKIYRVNPKDFEEDFVPAINENPRITPSQKIESIRKSLESALSVLRGVDERLESLEKKVAEDSAKAR